MREIHLDRKDRIENVGENEEELKIYSELTFNNINSLKILCVKKLDLSNSSNLSFFDSIFSNFASLINIILLENLKSIGNETGLLLQKIIVFI